MNAPFLRLWAAQTISICGTKMTQFAMSLWLFTETGLASALALLFAAGAVGTLIAQSCAGLVVDRYSRKVVMVCCDTGAAMVGVTLLYLSLTNNLQHWHLFALVAVSSPLSSLQGIAYRASVATMLDRKDLPRGASLATLTHYGTNIIAPAVAASIYPFYGLHGVIAADLLSFSVAMLLITTVSVPRISRAQTQEAATDSKPGAPRRGGALASWRANLREGLTYVRQDPRLRTLLLVQMAFMAFHEITTALWQPLLMARSGNDAMVVASVAMASGITGVLMSIWLSVYGGPRKPIRSYLLASLCAGCAKTLFGASSTAVQWQLTQALSSANFPVRAASYNTVWMAQVPHERQGQVFGFTALCVTLCMYVCFLGAALLADYVVQPWLEASPAVLGALSPVIGDGAGAAFALLYIIGGLGMALASLAGLRSNKLKDDPPIVPAAESEGAELKSLGAEGR